MKSIFRICQSICVFLVLNSAASAKQTETAEWEKEGCYIVKEDLTLSPQDLFEEFIKKDSRGEFLQSSPWLNKALVCPGYMGGPDVFYIISNKKIKALGKNKFRIIYSVEGEVTSKQIEQKLYSVFTPEKKRVEEDYLITKTPWGWKRLISINGGMLGVRTC